MTLATITPIRPSVLPASHLPEPRSWLVEGPPHRTFADYAEAIAFACSEGGEVRPLFTHPRDAPEVMAAHARAAGGMR